MTIRKRLRRLAGRGPGKPSPPREPSDAVEPDAAAERITSQEDRIFVRQDELPELVRKHFRRYPRSETGKQSEWLTRAQVLLEEVSPDALTHHNIKKIERHDLKIRRALSFKWFMAQESESRRLGLTSPAWMLDQKIDAYRFIDRIGVRRPKSDLETHRLSRAPITPPTVLKPRRSTGSRGCYLITSPQSIVHVRDGASFQSLDEMKEHAHTLMAPSRENARPLPDRWMVEELILEDHAAGTPARDLKFFCFYGEVVLYLEVRRHGGKSEYSFRTPDNRPVAPGNWNYEYFEGQGASTEEMDLARQISLEIPHPFCRIDMLKSEDGLVFGEFTPRPGGYNRFSPEWDRRMGEAWVRAQHRIFIDALHGKNFENFVRATGIVDHS